MPIAYSYNVGIACLYIALGLLEHYYAILSG